MRNQKALTCYAITFLIYAAITVWGKWGGITGNEMGYVFISFFVVIPILTFANGFALGGGSSALKWAYPVFAGLSIAIHAIVFSRFPTQYLLFSSLPAILGLLGGVGRRNKHRVRAFAVSRFKKPRKL
ncbi:hypothetical protein FACS189490_09120 [Clostridia bacterium]|nr:hypothetical protein FACS189490_09120 [Clostridia bacterium]